MAQTISAAIDQLPVISSGLAGLACAWIVWQVQSLATQPRVLPVSRRAFESTRREILRRGSGTYRWFEPLIDEIANLIAREGGKRREMLKRHLALAQPLPWMPEEFMATKVVEGVLVGTAVGLIVALTGRYTIAMMFALPLMLFYPEIARSSITSKGSKRLQKIRMRLPYAVDLISLMMEAGADFQQAMQTVVRQNQGHPLGEELNEVVLQIAAGRLRSEALEGFQDRLGDESVNELVFAINKGEELGTPLSTILRNQADQMRLKRSQWGEKAAGEAQVKILMPGMIIMIACLAVIITPIILPVVLKLFGE